MLTTLENINGVREENKFDVAISHLVYSQALAGSLCCAGSRDAAVDWLILMRWCLGTPSNVKNEVPMQQ